MELTADPESSVYDLVGIGFGPSNLALAIAIDEHNARTQRVEDRISAVFLEKQKRFGWHRGMLIEDATLQVSFLKDLVTMRNPASDFSFVSYLHHRDRLADFINHKTMFPLRIEFHDYLEWAADRMDHAVRYGNEVVDVQPVTQHCGEVSDVHFLDVVTKHAAKTEVIRGRNVVVAVGLELSMPPGVEVTERVWHNLDLLHRAAGFPVSRPERFIVVGAGQSAAESVAFLHERYPTAEVCSVFFRYGYSPADDSNFANRIFDPDAVDLYFDAPADIKRMLFDYHRNTNYSVVDNDLIEELYRRSYREKVLGRNRLQMLNASQVTALRQNADGISATIEFMPTGAERVLAADAIVFATGYRPVDAAALLGTAGGHCHRDAEGMVQMMRDYRAVTDDEVLAGIYLQGGTEHAHGITSTLLSNVAVRAGDITRSIAERIALGRTDPGTRSFVLTGDRGH